MKIRTNGSEGSEEEQMCMFYRDWPVNKEQEDHTATEGAVTPPVLYTATFVFNNPNFACSSCK